MSGRAKTSANAGRQQIDVCLDADINEALCRVGTLFHTARHGHSVSSFAYDPEWLRRPDTFEIDPDLQLHDAESYPNQPAGVLRISRTPLPTAGAACCSTVARPSRPARKNELVAQAFCSASVGS